MSNVDTLARKYIVQSILLTLGVVLLSFIVSHALGKEDIIQVPVVVGALFSIVVSVSIAIIWRYVAKNTPGMLTTFYTATSGFRMLLALIVMAIVYAVVGRDMMLPYVLAFVGFYFVMLAHHSLYFARITNKK